MTSSIGNKFKLIWSILTDCSFYPVFVSLVNNIVFSINVVIRETILLQKKKIIGYILKLNMW